MTLSFHANSYSNDKLCYFCWSLKTNSSWNNLKHCLYGRDVPRHNGTLQTEHFVCVNTTQPEWVFVPCILQYRHIFCLKLSVRINLWSPVPVTCIWLEAVAMVSLLVTLGAISAYRHWSCEFEPRSWWDVLDTTVCAKPITFTGFCSKTFRIYLLIFYSLCMFVI
jgi:hypothetical protein